MDELTADVVEHEHHRWAVTAADPRWALPLGWPIEAQEEAVLALVLLAPDRIDDTVRVLRRLPRLPPPR